jgi:hypothetical protein
LCRSSAPLISGQLTANIYKVLPAAASAGACQIASMQLQGEQRASTLPTQCQERPLLALKPQSIVWLRSASL